VALDRGQGGIGVGVQPAQACPQVLADAVAAEALLSRLDLFRIGVDRPCRVQVLARHGSHLPTKVVDHFPVSPYLK
jgi:hypothetical protein